jgi:radical SAM protein with 4Fe4S-binding SPASM domain
VAKFIAYAKQSGVVQVALTTNGTHLPPQLAEELVRSGLDRIVFSVDTIDPEAYREYRVGGELESVIANLRRLAECRQRLGAATPVIQAQALVTRQNESSLDGFAPALRAAGADEIRYKTFNVFMSGEDAAEDVLQFLPENDRYRRVESLEPRPAQRRDEMRLCRWPWDRLVILADGTITACCHDFNGEYPLGQVESDKTLDLWNTEQRREFIIRRILEPLSLPMCTRCPSAVPRLGLRREAEVASVAAT